MRGITSTRDDRGSGRWQSIVHEDDLPKTIAAWALAVATGEPYQVEYRLKHHATGKYRWHLGRALAMKDDGGRIVRWYGTATDIDGRKKTEEALLASERIYRAIGESIPFGIWITDPQGRNTYLSESFLKLMGRTQEQCSGFGWGDALHPDDQEKVLEAWRECARTEGKWEMEHRFRGADGQWHPTLGRRPREGRRRENPLLGGDQP